jgi:hypothetical protein
MKSRSAKKLYSGFVVFLSLISSIVVLPSSQASTSIPTSSMCKTLMPTFKSVYNKDRYSTLTGLDTRQMSQIRNIWKAQSNRLSKGSIKSQLDVLIDEMYGFMNQRPGSAIQWNGYIYNIADSCTPEHANVFCRTWKTALSTVLLGALTGNSRVSDLQAVRKVWAAQANKMPMGPSRLALTKAVSDLDELISETKRKRVSINIGSALNADIDILMSNPDGHWPCSIDPVLNALGAVDSSLVNPKHPSKICYEVYSWNNQSELKLACSDYPSFEWKGICTKYPFMSLRQIDGSGYTISTLKDARGNYFFDGKLSSDCDSSFPYEYDVRTTTYLGLGNHKYYIDGFNTPPTLAEVQAGGLHSGANQWVWNITVS